MRQRVVSVLWLGFCLSVLAPILGAAEPTLIPADAWKVTRNYDDNAIVFCKATDAAGKAFWYLDKAGDADQYELIMEIEPYQKGEVLWEEAILFSDTLIKKFQIQPLMRTVSLRADQMTPKRWNDLAKVPETFRLEMHHVQNAQIPELVEKLNALDKIEGVLLVLDDTATDAGIAPLKNVKRLRSLDLHECCNLTDKGVAALPSPQTAGLKRLWLPNHLTDASMATATLFPQLETLWVPNNDHVTDQGLANLKVLKQLKELNLSFCGALTDKGLTAIGAVPSLRALYLSGCRNFTSTGLKVLERMPRLENVLLFGWE